MRSETGTRAGFSRRAAGPGLAGLCLAWLFTATASAQTVALEYQVKASLVYNFLLFVDGIRDADSASLDLCIVGEDRYGAAAQALDGESVLERAITVHTYTSATDTRWVEICDVVVSTGNDRSQVQSLLQAAAQTGVLTIGESAAFLEDGGIIRMALGEETVRFEIDLTAARSAGLNISSRLLRLASNVIGGDA